MEQKSDEWKEVRKGKMTASKAAVIATAGVGLETYIFEILAEKHAVSCCDVDFQPFMSFEMRRGVELEEQARMGYELEYAEVTQIGFIEFDEYTGCSPDGLVGEDGGTEFKCLNNVAHLRLIVFGEKEIEKKFVLQCQMCLKLTGRKWWDLCFFNPNFEKNLLVFRIYPDLVMQEKLAIGIEKGKQLMINLEAQLLKSK